MAPRKKTQQKYWNIFEAYGNGMPLHEIQSNFDCCRATVFNAISYCRENALSLGTADELHIAIEAKRRRLQIMYDRLEFYRQGWDVSSVTKKADGTVFFTQVKKKFSPSAEVGLLRELRELEKDIEQLKGLHDWKTRGDATEEPSEGVDFDALQEAVDGLEGEVASS